MIDKQAIDKMTEMLPLIKKYGKLGGAEVETEASREYRRRAWVITKMLSKLTEHAAESDFYNLLSDRVSETDKERQRCYNVARQEDREFMKVLCEFDERAAEFAATSAGRNKKTKTQVVQEIELLAARLETARSHLESTQGTAKEKAAKRKIKDVPAFVARDTSVIRARENLETVKDEFSKANAVAAARGFTVKVTKVRTVVTTIEPVEAPVLKSAKKMKKVVKAPVPQSTKKAKPVLKVVMAPAVKAKSIAAKKAA
jgi:hypothetical protein